MSVKLFLILTTSSGIFYNRRTAHSRARRTRSKKDNHVKRDETRKVTVPCPNLGAHFRIETPTHYIRTIEAECHNEVMMEFRTCPPRRLGKLLGGPKQESCDLFGGISYPYCISFRPLAKGAR